MLIDLIGSAIDVILEESEGKRVGIVLSGGLDSSTVAVLADTIREGLPTFTGYYQAVGYDERPYSHLVSHPEHHDILIRPQDFVAEFDKMCQFLRPPLQGVGMFGQWCVAKYVSEHIDVALSGEGSDELFGGYARQMIVAGEPPPVGYEDYQLPEGYPTDLQAALDYDFERLPDLLAVDDQMMGAWGVEARAPFTDVRVVYYAMHLPITERVGKRHLREAVRGIVPDAIVQRRDKMGFPAPFPLWCQSEPMKSFVGDRLGYLPDPAKPFAREWFHELVDKTTGVLA